MVCLSDTTDFYEQIRINASKSSSNTLRIFVAAFYVDSLASLKILTDLLRKDAILYSVYPVYGYEDITKHINSFQAEVNEPFNVVLINCGGSRAIEDDFQPNEMTTFFILDSQRPIHLSNIASDKVIVAWNEGDEVRHPNIVEIAQIDDEDDLSDEEDTYQHSDVGEKRRRQEHRAFQQEKQDYLSLGTYFGRPTGCSMYDAARIQRKDETFHLWLSCVALTDHFVHFRISGEEYQDSCMVLEERINGIGGSSKPRTATLEGGLTTKLPEDFRIEYQEEMMLMCLPRWNLFRSMECSTYSCTKLKTWSEPGRKRLKLFFAEMGIKHQSAQQKYPYMDNDIKRRLKDKIHRVASKYQMEGINFRSFQLLNGYKTNISAANLVFSLTALLESSTSKETQGDSFWTAASAIHWKGWKEVEQGMDLAIKVQEAIVRVGSSLVTRKDMIKTAGSRGGRLKLQHFSLDASQDAEILAHPLSLTRLVHFIRDILANQGDKPYPMVAAATITGSNKTLLVGVMEKPQGQDKTGNLFGLAFVEAANSLGIDVQQNVFELSCFEIEKEYVDNFIHRLGKIISRISGRL